MIVFTFELQDCLSVVDEEHAGSFLFVFSMSRFGRFVLSSSVEQMSYVSKQLWRLVSPEHYVDDVLIKRLYCICIVPIYVLPVSCSSLGDVGEPALSVVKRVNFSGYISVKLSYNEDV
jgi:hypothetical protein